MTSSAADPQALERARRQTFLALFTALAIAVHTLEVLLPSPVPWFRLGLANALTLVVLFLYGSRAAWGLALTRIGLGALLLGRLFSPGFWLALTGGVLATLVMVAARRSGRSRLGPIGVSALGAAGHTLGQVGAAWLLLVRHPAIWQTLPVFLLFSVAAGVLTGWLAATLIRHLERHPLLQPGLTDGSGDDRLVAEMVTQEEE